MTPLLEATRTTTMLEVVSKAVTMEDSKATTVVSSKAVILETITVDSRITVDNRTMEVSRMATTDSKVMVSKATTVRMEEVITMVAETTTVEEISRLPLHWILLRYSQMRPTMGRILRSMVRHLRRHRQTTSSISVLPRTCRSAMVNRSRAEVATRHRW